MLLIAILTHAPEHCLWRPENAEAAKQNIKHFENMEELQKKTGVKCIARYVCDNEHTFYFILEADDYPSVGRFLGPIMVQYHTAKITPIRQVWPR